MITFMSQNGPQDGPQDGPHGVQGGPAGSGYGINAGTRWRDANDSTTVIVLWVQRTGVVVYRREGAALDDECVTNVVRFVETYAPANDAFRCDA
jgi:hypothetical protein